MISKNNHRLIITFSKKQTDFLEKTSKKLKISKSRLVRMLIRKNINDIKKQLTEEQWRQLIKIAQTPWLD